jgi:hypothetical protein
MNTGTTNTGNYLTFLLTVKVELTIEATNLYSFRLANEFKWNLLSLTD